MNSGLILYIMSMFGLCYKSFAASSCHRLKRPLFAARLGSRNISSESSSPSSRRAYLAVGSNLGDRFQNIVQGLDQLCNNTCDINVTRTSALIETAPMYVTDQPAFLNGVVEIETTLEPPNLLRRIKQVEKDLGRASNGIRNGPRPLDLDILFYDVDASNTTSLVLDEPDLEIPHPRVLEREFVLAPLMDIGAGNLVHPLTNSTVSELLSRLLQQSPSDAPVRVLPLARGRVLHLNETIVMGILNVTPDSFSDGGNYDGRVDLAVREALNMVKDGAGIIDVGGESTRPGAKEVAIDEELERTIPVIEKIREFNTDIPISIDTRHAIVAEAALKSGADIVNDVSGGTFDPEMLPTVSKFRATMVLMHMRGTPENMQTMTEYEKQGVVHEVASELRERSKEAEKAGIHRWQQVLDPGIGFAKDLNANLILLKHYGKLQSMLGHIPFLLGTSRKGFIGKVTGETVAKDRDYGTLASCIAAMSLAKNPVSGVSILRVHNVKGIKQGVLVFDAIYGANSEVKAK